MVEHTGNRICIGQTWSAYCIYSSKLAALISSLPVEYGLVEFTRPMELAKVIGFKDFNDCLHTAIAEQHCSDFYTCNYRDFKRIQPLTSLNIHFL